jgi:hypothetical protein
VAGEAEEGLCVGLSPGPAEGSEAGQLPGLELLVCPGCAAWGKSHASAVNFTSHVPQILRALSRLCLFGIG